MSARNWVVCDYLCRGWEGVSYLDTPDLLDEIRSAEKARAMLHNTLNTVIVPIEVCEEVENHTDFFRKKINFLYHSRHGIASKKKNFCNRESQKLKYLKLYVDTLEKFQQESTGLDPRYTELRSSLLQRVDMNSRDYQRAFSFYSDEVLLRHREKDQDVSQADIALATLAYVIQKKTHTTPCIITRDTDFNYLALKTAADARKEDTEYEEGHVVTIHGSEYSLRVYLPRR